MVLAVVVGLPAALWAYDRAWKGEALEVVAQVPEAGGWRPRRIEAQAGQVLLLRLTSADVVHGFAIPGLDVEVQEIEPGKVKELSLALSRPGRYRFVCTVVCSPRHGEMVGELWVYPKGGGPILEEQKAFDGKALFRTYCAACHGERGEGRIGPPLNARGRVPGMDPTTLRRILEEGRPGTAMPAWKDRLTPEEIQALIEFLQTLSQEDAGR